MSESKRLDVVLDAGSLNGSVPSLPFAVTFEGEPYRVLRLFDATVELEAKRDGYKCTLRKSSVLVDPDVIQWYPATKPTPPRQPQPELRVVSEGIEEKDEMATATTKRCPKCGNEKDLEAFAKRASASDGRQSQCRDCMSGYWKKKKPAIGSAAQAVQDPGEKAAEPVVGKRRMKKSKKVGRPRKLSRIQERKQPTAAHANGRPSLTFKELVASAKAIRVERDALKVERDQLLAEKANLFAQLQEVLS